MCDNVHALCVAPEQVVACVGPAQDAPCSYRRVIDGRPELVSGACVDRVCLATHWLATSVVSGSPGGLANPAGVAIDGSGNVYIADPGNQRIVRADAATGTLVTVAGTGTRCASSTAPCGDGGAATNAELSDPSGVALDGLGGVYIADTSNHRIRRADMATGTITTVAGTGTACALSACGDGGASDVAQLRAPEGLFLDAQTHALYVADTGDHAVRKVDLDTNIVTTVVDTRHSLGFFGDDAAAAAALLYKPSAITRCANGDLFIADTGNNRVRRVDEAVTRTITTVLGDGVAASSGQGTPAKSFSVDKPRGVACDELGNLFVTSSTAVRLLAATEGDHIIDGSGDVQTIYAPPSDHFPTSATGCLAGLAVIGPTAIQIADSCNGLVVRLDRILDIP